MRILSAVNVRSCSISVRVSISPKGLPRVSIIFARRFPSRTITGSLCGIAVAVNSTGSEIFGAVTRTVVVPGFAPSRKCAIASPLVSVSTVGALSSPSPAVMVNVTGTPANHLSH